MSTKEDVCVKCGHKRSQHYHDKGSCRAEEGKRMCVCSRFRVLRWGSTVKALCGFVVRDVKFRTHTQPPIMGRRLELLDLSNNSTHWVVIERYQDGIPVVRFLLNPQ